MEPGASRVLWPFGVAQGVALVKGSLSLRCGGAGVRETPERGAGPQRRALLHHKSVHHSRSLCHMCCRCGCNCIPALVPHGASRLLVKELPTVLLDIYIIVNVAVYVYDCA